MQRSSWNHYVQRKTVDREAKNPQILLAKGDISIADKALLTQLLGKFGLDSKFMTPEDYKAKTRRIATIIVASEAEILHEPKRPFSFLNITSPEQYLVREHFEDFNRMRPDVFQGPTAVGSIFTMLVDGNGPWMIYDTDPETNRRELRTPVPMDGIVIAPREQKGFPPYNGTAVNDKITKNILCAPYAIQAGSIVEVATAFNEKFRTTGKQEVTIILSQQLQSQFISPE